MPMASTGRACRVPRVGSGFLPALTEREQDVLVAVARGLSNAEICTSLHMSLSTAKTHISHLLMKLGARDRTQLVVLPTRWDSPYAGCREARAGSAPPS
jgi:DNA-binding NarL/FixJ family response regulator